MRIRLPARILHMLVLQVLNLTVKCSKHLLRAFDQGRGFHLRIMCYRQIKLSALAGVKRRLAEQRKQKLVLKV